MKIKIDAYNALIILIVIDLIFLPRLTVPFAMPLSLLVIIVYVFTNNVIKASYYKLLLTTLFFIIIVCSILNGEDGYIVDNIKRGVQLITSIIYFAFLSSAVKSDKIDLRAIRLILILGVVYIFSLLVLFNYSSDLYINIIRSIYPETGSNVSSILLFMRFQYAFSDPNSFGYFSCFLLAFALCLKGSTKYNFFMLFFIGILVLSSQSRGALISYILIICVYFILDRKISILKKIGIILAASSIFTFLYISSDNLSNSVDSINERSDTEESVGGGRIEKYEYFFENFNILPIGKGYSLEKDGSYFRPHSDIIRMNLSYGFFAMIFTFVFFYPRSRKELMITFPILICAVINTVIDDYRLLNLCLLTMSFIRYRTDELTYKGEI